MQQHILAKCCSISQIKFTNTRLTRPKLRSGTCSPYRHDRSVSDRFGSKHGQGTCSCAVGSHGISGYLGCASWSPEGSWIPTVDQSYERTGRSNVLRAQAGVAEFSGAAPRRGEIPLTTAWPFRHSENGEGGDDVSSSDSSTSVESSSD